MLKRQELIEGKKVVFRLTTQSKMMNMFSLTRVIPKYYILNNLFDIRYVI